MRGDCIKHSLIESWLILITCFDQKLITWLWSHDHIFGSFCCVRDYEPCNWANLFLRPSTSEDSASCADIAFWTSVKSFGCSWFRLKIGQIRSNEVNLGQIRQKLAKKMFSDRSNEGVIWRSLWGQIMWSRSKTVNWRSLSMEVFDKNFLNFWVKIVEWISWTNSNESD